jgi:hypothetical protein
MCVNNNIKFQVYPLFHKFDHSNFGLDLNPSTLSSAFLCDTKNIEFSEWDYYLFSHLGETPEQRFQKQKMSPLEHQGSWTGLPNYWLQLYRHDFYAFVD